MFISNLSNFSSSNTVLTKCVDNRHQVWVTPHMILCILRFIIMHPTSFSKGGDINSSNLLVSSYMLSHDLKCRLDLRLFGHGVLPKRDLKISPIKFSKMMW